MAIGRGYTAGVTKRGGLQRRVGRLGLAACGLRSEAADDVGEDSSMPWGETEVDMRLGSCDTPYEVPFANFAVRGRLAGPGSVRGWCGRDDDDAPDAGPEDSYLVTPTFDVDVLVLIDEAEFEPSLRVTRDGCREDVLPEVCAAPVGDDQWHFFAQAGSTYTITIDSPRETDGRYRMQFIYGDPGIDACRVHPSQINQEVGGYFTWSNEFGKRQGKVSGKCGGPGAENLFQVNVNSPGRMTFLVTADTKFEPVVSVRSGCGGATELQCANDTAGNGVVELSYRFDVPGTYYVAVDQANIEGGSYKLEVFSE